MSVNRFIIDVCSFLCWSIDKRHLMSQIIFLSLFNRTWCLQLNNLSLVIVHLILSVLVCILPLLVSIKHQVIVIHRCCRWIAGLSLNLLRNGFIHHFPIYFEGIICLVNCNWLHVRRDPFVLPTASVLSRCRAHVTLRVKGKGYGRHVLTCRCRWYMPAFAEVMEVEVLISCS